MSNPWLVAVQNWKPDRAFWEAYIACFCGSLVAMLSLLGSTVALLWVVTGMSMEHFEPGAGGMSTIGIMLSTSVIFASFVAFMLTILTPEEEGRARYLREVIAPYGRSMVRNCNPVGAIVWLLRRAL